MTETTAPKTKVKKPKGPIRWEAIIPFTIIVAVIVLYFHFFFDTHLRKALEWGGYKAVGAEVNIANLETSFFNASIRIQGIEITDAEKPTHDSIKIGDIRFGMLWDALLRVKVVVNEAVVEQIEFGVLRKKPGKVAPPEPPSNEPSKVAQEADRLKEEALRQAEEKYSDNVLGDVVALVAGGDAQAQLNKLQESMPSKAMLTKFEADFKEKQKNWDARLKTLPQGKEVQALSDRLNKVKYKDLKNAQELQTSLQELDSIAKEADAKYKTIQSAGNDLSNDMKTVDAQFKELEKQIKLDIDSLKTHFRIPKLDAATMSKAVFRRYLAPYMAKFERYKGLAEKYMPPNLLKKKDASDEVAIQPHPRENGISYEFGRPNSYPLVWIKKTAVSSQAGLSKDAGNIRGEILDITTHQKLIGRPTIATLSGDFPAKEIFGFLLKLTLDNRKELSEIDYAFNVKSYPLDGKELVKTPDVQIAFAKANGMLGIDGKLIGLRDFTLRMNNEFTKVDYQISAKEKVAEDILKAVFAGIPMINLTVDGAGRLPSMPLNINSNLGPEIGRGFEKQIRAKIEEAQKQIQAYVDKEVGNRKAELEKQINAAKSQIDNEVKKVQAQLDKEKKTAENKINDAKKDAENQGKKQLEKEGKKQLDDLKKKFGL
jgi:TIGR03545 family protein